MGERLFDYADRLRALLADRDAEIVRLETTYANALVELQVKDSQYSVLHMEYDGLRAEIVRLREWVEKHQHAYDTGRCPECDYNVADYHPEFQPTHSETCSVPSLLSPSPQGANK